MARWPTLVTFQNGDPLMLCTIDPSELKSIVHNDHSTMPYLNHETDDVIL